MADKQYVHLLCFSFGSRRFAYIRLHKNLGKFLLASASVMREPLDPAAKAGRCAQLIDDIGVATNTASELLENLDFMLKQF